MNIRVVALCLASWLLSSICLFAADQEKPVPEPAAEPATPVLEVVIDVSEVPQHQEWADKAAKLCKEWYPKLVATLPSDGYTPPTKVTLQFKKDMKGVAHTINDRIVIASDWITKHPEDIGMVHHELVHFVQQYRKPNRGAGWLVEGIADYLRWYVYEPTAMKPDELRRAQYANPEKAKFNDSYRTTASFLNYVVKNIDPDAVSKLNVLLREGKYSDKELEVITKKPLSEVEADWKGSLRKK
jgi:hypothetical protein